MVKLLSFEGHMEYLVAQLQNNIAIQEKALSSLDFYGAAISQLRLWSIRGLPPFTPSSAPKETLQAAALEHLGNIGKLSKENCLEFGELAYPGNPAQAEIAAKALSRLNGDVVSFVWQLFNTCISDRSAFVLLDAVFESKSPHLRELREAIIGLISKLTIQIVQPWAMKHAADGDLPINDFLDHIAGVKEYQASEHDKRRLLQLFY